MGQKESASTKAVSGARAGGLSRSQSRLAGKLAECGAPLPDLVRQVDNRYESIGNTIV